VRTDTAQEWVLPNPSRSIRDGTLQLVRGDRVFHVAQRLDEFPPR
jgi:hypothetical protein